MESDAFVMKNPQKNKAESNGQIPDPNEILIIPPTTDDSHAARIREERDKALDRWLLLRRTQHLLTERKLN